MNAPRFWLCVALLSLPPTAHGEGPFFQLSGKNGFRASPGAPDDASKLLGETQKAGDAIKCFAFTPAGDWVLLCGGNGYYTSNLDLPACKKLNALQKDTDDFKCVAFAPAGGWTVLWGQNGNWTEGSIPDAAFKKMQDVARRGGTLRSIAFGPRGAWVLLCDQAGAWYGNVPKDLAEVLQNAIRKHVAVRCVAFCGEDWTCLSDAGWWTSNVDLPSSKAIARADREQHFPRWLAIKPVPYDFQKFPPVHYLDAIVAKSGVKADTPGVGVLVIDHGKVLLEKCYGLAHLRDRQPITPQTTFELASCSKQFTGAAILRLQEQGKLSIDDPVRKYLPELPVYDKSHPIRISHLARHTSGLREYFEFPDVKGKHPNYLVNDDYVGLFARERAKFPLYFRTGSDFRYTNTNFMLLALVVQRVAREPFGAFLKHAFFDPLGMKTATVYELPSCTPHQPALGYHKDKDKDKNTFEESWGPPPFRHERLLLAGDGSIWASLNDMAHWDAGWRQGKVLQPATIKQALVPSAYGAGKTTDYAFGWGVDVDEDDGTLRKMSHNGGWGGFATHVSRDLAHARTIVVLANVDCVDVEAILRLCAALPAHAQD